MKNLTEMVFILDNSGSMSGMEADTVGGFNSMIAKQKAMEGQAYVTTVLFNNEASTLHDRVAIDKILPMTAEEYSVGGCTALLDAIGTTIRHIENIHKYARPEDVPEHTVFVITTDGMENASHIYSHGKIREMISRKKECGWEFLFVAANIDAVETAAAIGISRERAANYRQTGKGTRSVFEAVSCAVTAKRNCAPMAEEWKGMLED